jgi:hypothetical protein
MSTGEPAVVLKDTSPTRMLGSVRTLLAPPLKTIVYGATYGALT